MNRKTDFAEKRRLKARLEGLLPLPDCRSLSQERPPYPKDTCLKDPRVLTACRDLLLDNRCPGEYSVYPDCKHHTKADPTSCVHPEAARNKLPMVRSCFHLRALRRCPEGNGLDPRYLFLRRGRWYREGKQSR